MESQSFLLNGKSVYYTVIPYCPFDGYPYAASSVLDWYTMISSQYLADMVACPEFYTGWINRSINGLPFAPPGSVGLHPIVRSVSAVRLNNGYVVSPIWSNLKNGPVAPQGSIPIPRR
jgi:hypothetical protein